MDYSTTLNAVTCDNMIIVDADFADKVVFDLTVNFERMIGRRIPKADLARWIDCLALDGGIREGKEQTQVVLIHSKNKISLENFTPGKYKEEIDGKAFNDNLGEFLLTTVSEEKIANKEELLLSTLNLCFSTQKIKRVIVVPDDSYYDSVRAEIRRNGGGKDVTVLAMQPMPGGNFKQEILGYSLMNALGIKSEELIGE